MGMVRDYAHTLKSGVVVALVAIAFAAFASPAMVIADGGVIWSWVRGDSCSWTQGCVSGFAFIDEEIDGTSITDSIACRHATVSIGFEKSSPVCPVRFAVENYERELPELSSGEASFKIFGLDTDYVSFNNPGACTATISGVVITCNDYLTSTEDYSVLARVDYGQGGVILCLLFMSGLTLLNTLIHLAERVTDR